MTRTLTLVALALLVVGCTRYGKRPDGPFARQPKLDSKATVPPGPRPDNSPLALATSPQPEAPRPPDDKTLVPSRPDPYAGIQPTGGVSPDATAFPPPGRRNPEPPPPPAPSDAPPVRPAPPSPKAVDPAQAAARHVAEVKKLAAAAAERWAKTGTYEAVVTRRELSPKGKMTEDVVLYQFRKEPMSVYIRNLGESGKGREILYNPTQHKDVIHVILGKGDENLLYKAGDKGPALSPDNGLVKRESRYSIREAGWGTPIARVGMWAGKAEAGKIPADALTFHGPVERKEFPYPVVGVQLKLRPGDDPLLPDGGVRQWFFDPKPDSPSHALPILIIATEPDGREVEYYQFEKVKLGVPFTDAEFSPERLNVRKK